MDVSEERITPSITVARIGELGTILRSMIRFLVTSNIVPSLQILVTMKIEAISFSKAKRI
jgi:hypothetical protein